MTVSDALQGLTKVFLDTAPVVYYIEATPEFAVIVDTAFALLDKGQFQAVVYPVTLTEGGTFCSSIHRLTHDRFWLFNPPRNLIRPEIRCEFSIWKNGAGFS